MKKEFVELRINRRQHQLAVEPGALRQDLGLTESKRGYHESCPDSAVPPGDDSSLHQAQGVGSGKLLSLMR
jgi:hypothetical protein